MRLILPFFTETLRRSKNNWTITRTITTMSSSLSNYKAYQLPKKEEGRDWVDELELDFVSELAKKEEPIKVLVLYGSLRETSYSRLLAYEACRILERLHCDVRVFDPTGLPINDESAVNTKHEKVQELRGLSEWSQAQFWCSPEKHGTVTSVFKNQIDWIPLSLGSVRPTQGRTLAVAQVNGGSQSFNAVNALRILGRWMRMITAPNQSSVPKAWTEFDNQGRMKPSSLRDRVVDVVEELVKFTLLTRPVADMLVDRYSEREEKRIKGRLLSQAEKEASKSSN
jgi:arsenic resistance protein ArsH